jgi:hypothetical protein
LAPASATSSGFLVDRVSDVIGIDFGQQEVALFIPGSGDVLLCSRNAWSDLKNSVAANVQNAPTVPLDEPVSGEAEDPADGLRAMLVKLGAFIA